MTWDTPTPWALAVFAAGLGAVWGKRPDKKGRMLVHYLCKPLTTLLLLGTAARFVPEVPGKPWFLLGLLLSVLGDAALMLPIRGFVLGLAAFLVGLACYAWAFTLETPFAPRQLVYWILPAAVGALIAQSLWPRLGKYRAPVAVYVVVLVTMGWRAFSRFDNPEVALGDWIDGSLGAVLFMSGDALLARRRFLEQPAPYWLELGVYYLAQWMLIASLAVW